MQGTGRARARERTRRRPLFSSALCAAAMLLCVLMKPLQDKDDDINSLVNFLNNPSRGGVWYDVETEWMFQCDVEGLGRVKTLYIDLTLLPESLPADWSYLTEVTEATIHTDQETMRRLSDDGKLKEGCAETARLSAALSRALARVAGLPSLCELTFDCVVAETLEPGAAGFLSLERVTVERSELRDLRLLNRVQSDKLISVCILSSHVQEASLDRIELPALKDLQISLGDLDGADLMSQITAPNLEWFNFGSAGADRIPPETLARFPKLEEQRRASSASEQGCFGAQ